MVKKRFFLKSMALLFAAWSMTTYAMDERLVEAEKKPKSRSSVQEKALVIGKKAVEHGHKKTADRILRHVTGPTAVYWRSECTDDPDAQRSLKKKAAMTPSSKPSRSKEAAAEDVIESYIKTLRAYREKLSEATPLEPWDKNATLRAYQACKEQIIRLLVESIRARNPKIRYYAAETEAKSEFAPGGRFQDVQLPESLVDTRHESDDDEQELHVLSCDLIKTISQNLAKLWD